MKALPWSDRLFLFPDSCWFGWMIWDGCRIGRRRPGFNFQCSAKLQGQDRVEVVLLTTCVVDVFGRHLWVDGKCKLSSGIMKKRSWVLEVAAGLGMASAYFCCLPHCHGVSFPKSALFQVIALLSRPGTQHQMTLGSCVECLSEILRVFGPIPPPSSAASRALSVAGECWQMYFESLLIIISHYPVYALIGDD